MAVFDVDFAYTDPQLVIPYGGGPRGRAGWGTRAPAEGNPIAPKAPNSAFLPLY